MQTLVTKCRCGGIAFGYIESKANESDYKLIGIKCEKCGKEFYKRLKKMCQPITQQHAWEKILKQWNDWSKEETL